ncbi:Hydrolase or acyltransferase [Pseudomonas sp. 8Z]|uniref:alpha/beta hydrolase family protein n=1 Tax=Pseudomonas sp. 8Z TaxID=2653166 RepID=UPI0012EFCC91|nr:alpha/beta hydrolase family protein [Pseudomonas sp. 8Z]VXC93293.1 Hydrolase or acyltransferase [Pseudomonas sp. 8Z]
MRATSPALLGLCLLISASAWAQESAPVNSATPADATTPPENERQPLPERSVSETQALEQRLDKREQQMLQANQESFLALWLPANVGEPTGAIILLPADMENANDAQVIGPLRRKLPDSGWNSLSLTLPDPDGDPLPPRSTTPTPAENSTNPPTEPSAKANGEASPPAEAASNTPTIPSPQERRDAHAERVMARIDAAIEFAKQQESIHIVLLGHGSGAYWAIRYLNERKPASVQNLLMVAPTVPAGFTPPLDELVTQLPVAVGDFYYRDQVEERNAALKRLQASKRAKLPTYIQVAMKALPGNRAVEQEQLYRRLRGWLKQHLRKLS